MRFTFCLLFLLTSCSVSRYYQAADVGQELKKNSVQLEVLAFNVDKDFLDKAAFYENYKSEQGGKDHYILGDLEFRLNELKMKRDAILNKSHSIKTINDKLMSKIDSKSKISDSDPLYQDIEKFAETTKKDAHKLFNQYAEYKNASHEFAKFAMFTGNFRRPTTKVENI